MHVILTLHPKFQTQRMPRFQKGYYTNKHIKISLKSNQKYTIEGFFNIIIHVDTTVVNCLHRLINAR